MRQFALYIDEAVQGPFSEYEVQDMIHSGKVTAETLCAPAGSEAWEPLANHFTFGSNLKLSRRTTERPAGTEETEPTLPRLDHDIRRRLLMYGLADSASVDQISPIQADILIRETETRIRRQIFTWRIATYVCIGAGALGGWIGLTTAPVIDTLGNVAESVAKQQDTKANTQWSNFSRRAKEFEEGSIAASKVPFSDPQGGVAAGPVLLGRLQVSEETAYNFSTRIDLNSETLVGPLAKFGINLEPRRTVHILGVDLPEDILRKARAQAETLQLVISPLLDSAQFEPMRDELLGKFPDAPEIPEASRLRAELATIKVSELQMAADKVLFKARESETLAEGKGAKSGSGASPKAYAAWAPRLRDFAGQINLLRDRIRINTDPEARRKVWSDFNLGTGAELAAWVLSHGARTMESNEQGNLSLTETANLRADTLQRRALVSFRINEDTVFLPWDSSFLVTGEVTSTRIPNDVFLARERYKVVSLVESGGKRYVFRSDVGGRMLSFFRESPKVYYFAVAREKDTDVLTVRVTEAMFHAAKRGDVIPFETLINLPVHANPAEPIAPNTLTPE